MREKVICEFNKLHHDQDYLLKWMNLYVEQIKNLEKEIYSLKLKSYVHNNTLQQSQQLSQPQPQQPLQPQQQQPPYQPQPQQS